MSLFKRFFKGSDDAEAKKLKKAQERAAKDTEMKAVKEESKKKKRGAERDFWQDTDVRMGITPVDVEFATGEVLLSVLNGVSFTPPRGDEIGPGLLRLTNLRIIWMGEATHGHAVDAPPHSSVSIGLSGVTSLSYHSTTLMAVSTFNDTNATYEFNVGAPRASELPTPGDDGAAAANDHDERYEDHHHNGEGAGHAAIDVDHNGGGDPSSAGVTAPPSPGHHHDDDQHDEPPPPQPQQQAATDYDHPFDKFNEEAAASREPLGDDLIPTHVPPPRLYELAEKAWLDCRSSRVYRSLRVHSQNLIRSDGRLITLPGEIILYQFKDVANLTKAGDDPRPGTLYVTNVQVAWADDVGLFNFAVPHVHLADVVLKKVADFGYIVVLRTDRHSRHLTLAFQGNDKKDTRLVYDRLHHTWKSCLSVPFFGLSVPIGGVASSNQSSRRPSLNVAAGRLMSDSSELSPNLFSMSNADGGDSAPLVK